MAGPFSSEANSVTDKSGADHKADGFDGNKLSLETQNQLLTQAALKHQMSQVERANPNVTDLVGEGLYSAAYAGVQEPAIGLAQLSDKVHLTSGLAKKVEFMNAPAHEEFGTARWHAQQIGGALGMTAPFLATKGALAKSGLSLVARTEATAATSGKLFSLVNGAAVADGAITGFAYDFIARPVAPSEGNFWEARLKHGATGAVTFGALTAGSVGLRHVSGSLAKELVGVKKLAYETGIGAASGLPAGSLNADVTSLLKTGHLASGEDRLKGMYTMSMVGGTLSALHRLPGQERTSSERALETQQHKAGVDNLQAMLGERARSARLGDLRLDGAKTETSRPASIGDGLFSRSRTGSATDAIVNEGLMRGRALASGDRQVKTSVTPELQPFLQKGAEMAMGASEATASAREVADFFNFARSPEGQQLRDSMLDVAEQTRDQRMMTIVREAYLPVEGMHHRITPGEMTILPDRGTKPTEEQINRWYDFLDIMQKSNPTDVESYALYRNNVFDWLNKNPDLHNWARQFAEQTSMSNQAAPIDFYFETNILNRFIKVQDGTFDSKPVTMGELASLRQLSSKFADQVGEYPYDAKIVENFTNLMKESGDVRLPLLVEHVNSVLREQGLNTTTFAQMKGENQIVLYRPKTVVKTDSRLAVDYNEGGAVEAGVAKPDAVRVNEIANTFAQHLAGAKTIQSAQYMLTEAALNMKQLGVEGKDVVTELNWVMSRNKMGFEAAISPEGVLEVVHKTKTETVVPLVSVMRTREGHVLTEVYDAEGKPVSE